MLPSQAQSTYHHRFYMQIGIAPYRAAISVSFLWKLSGNTVVWILCGLLLNFHFVPLTVFLTTDISAGRQKLHEQVQIDVGELSAHGSNTATFYVFSFQEAEIKLHQRLSYTLDVDRSAMTAAGGGGITATLATTPSSSETTPEHVKLMNSSSLAAAAALVSPVQIEYLDETRLRKSREDTLLLHCVNEFKFNARFYTMNRRPLSQVYRGENFLLRANTEVVAPDELEILDSFFICVSWTYMN